jgi:hypothetical protein
MRDNNFQIGGTGNKQKVVNNPRQKSWQDNIPLFVVISVVIAVIALIIGKQLGL